MNEGTDLGNLRLGLWDLWDLCLLFLLLDFYFCLVGISPSVPSSPRLSLSSTMYVPVSGLGDEVSGYPVSGLWPCCLSSLGLVLGYMQGLFFNCSAFLLGLGYQYWKVGCQCRSWV
ncbi:hypothetical protein V8F06_000648 [Rhypophila decipiens]